MYRISIIFLLILLVSCANIQPPSGGPEDKEPPQITDYQPTNNSTNYKGPVIIGFDKYMDRSKVIENISIVPDLKFEVDWHGKDLVLNFVEGLKDNTTYSINLGTDYSDNHGNKPTNSFSIVFSSGNNLDSGVIKGKLYSSKPQGKFIFCYSNSIHNFDTLDYSRTKPDYKIQVGSSGDFIIPALKDGIYRIIAVDDILKNSLIDKNDAVGMATEDFIVKDAKSHFASIKDVILIDKTAPEISNIFAKYSDKISIKFTKMMNDTSINLSSFTLSDSLDNIVSNSIKVAKVMEQQNVYEFLLDHQIDNKSLLTIKFDKDRLPTDTAGNYLDITKPFKFMMMGSKDTTSIYLLSKPFADSASGILTNQVYPFYFSSFINKDIAQIDYKLIQSTNNKEIPAEIIKSNGNSIIIKPNEQLLENTGYKLFVNFKNIANISSNKSLDTNIVMNFTTVDKRNTGDISGKFVRARFECESNTYLILSSKNAHYKIKLEEDGSFSAKCIDEGEYNIELFCDMNGNSIYDYGSIKPFNFAEKFYIHNQTIKVKSRWTIDNIMITEKNNDFE